MANRFSIEAVFKAIDNITGPVSRMQSRVSNFSKSAVGDLNKVNAITGKVLGGMKKAGVGIAAGAAVAGAALATAAIPGMAFEQQMADLGATSLQTRDQIKPLEDLALSLGASTKFSATEVAAAMEEMAKAGFTNQEILDGVGGMVYAAAAAGEELAATTENVSSVMKGMALPTSEAARVADVLALASVRTNSSIGTLGESMSKVSSTARQLGVPLEDTVAMVALLQDVGLDASEAGSATATMLTMLAKPTDAIKAKMRDMGVSFKDASGNMLAPAEVLGQLVKAGDKAGGNMEQVAFFADLVGLRGQKAAVNLKDLFKAGKVTALTDELKNAAGTAQKMADLRMNTFGGDLDVALENIKGVQIELFGLASGPLREVAQGFAKWVDANKAMVVSGIVGVIHGIADAIPTIVKWGERIFRVVKVLGYFAAAVAALTAPFIALNFVLAVTPIGWILAGLALLIAFWPEVSAFFGRIVDGAMDLGAKLFAVIKPAIDAIKNYFMGWFHFYVGVVRMAVEFWQGVWSTVAPYFASIWSGITNVVSTFGAFVVAGAAYVVEALRFIWQPVGEFFAAVWGGITAGVSGAWDFVSAGATIAVEKIKSAFSVLTGFFTELWNGVTGKFDAIVGPVIDGIKEFVNMAQKIGGGTTAASDGAPASGPTPQVVSPQEQVAQSVTESINTTRAEVTIRDKTGRAEITKAPRRGSIDMSLAPSGGL